MTHNTEVEAWEATVDSWKMYPDYDMIDYDRVRIDDIKDFINHQLQKVRQDWLREEIVKLKEVLTNKQYADISPFDHAEVVRVEALQTIIDSYQAELEQDVSK